MYIKKNILTWHSELCYKTNKHFLLFLYFLEVCSCTHLQVLELERIPDLSLQVATELCRAGLKSLQMLILTHTPVSGQAILHFHSEIRFCCFLCSDCLRRINVLSTCAGVCSSIRSIVVDVSVSDYFEEPDTQEAKHLFGEILSTLKVSFTQR